MKDSTEAEGIFMDDVWREMERALELHGDFKSLHEAYAVILEEMDEFWEHVRKRKESRNPAEMRNELIQIAAMCWKTAKFLGVEAQICASEEAELFPEREGF